MSGPPWAWLLLALPAAAVLLLAAANMALWPRGRAGGRMPGTASVLVPARDEAERIEACVRAALACGPAEVVVYDDGSADGTGDVVRRLAAGDGRVRLLRGGPLPDGWVGKPHACHHLAAAARGDVLVFVDADTVARPECLARLGSVFEAYNADLVSAGTRQETGSFAERLVIPLLHLTYLAWLPLPLVWRTRDPRMVVANGQLLAVRRAAYDRAGGWAAVAGEIVDDLAFARRVKRTGGRVVFADGHLMARCRMYRGADEVWRGFSKNLYEGVGGRPAGLLGFALLYATVFLLPYLALAGPRALLPAAAAGVAANLLLRLLLALRFRQPPEGVLLHPLGVAALLAIALKSAAWSRRGAIRWRGRSYAGREARRAPLPADPSAPTLPRHPNGGERWGGR